MFPPFRNNYPESDVEEAIKRFFVTLDGAPPEVTHLQVKAAAFNMAAALETFPDLPDDVW